MRTSVRADNADLVANDIASRVSLALNEQDAALVAVFVKAFVVPNSQYSQELTTAAQQAARDAVQPVVESYKAGETIVAGGAIISPADMDALQELGLIQSEQPVETYLSAAALTLSCAVLVGLYFYRHPRMPFLTDARSLLVLAFVFLVFVLTARLVVPNRTIVPYAFPLPAVGLLLATLFGMETGIILSLVICVLASYGQTNTVILMPYYLLATLCGTVMLGQARRFWSFFRAGVTIAVVGAAMILAYRLSTGPIDWIGLATLVGRGRIQWSGLRGTRVAPPVSVGAVPEPADRAAAARDFPPRFPAAAGVPAQGPGHISAQPARGQPCRAGGREYRRRSIVDARRRHVPRYREDRGRSVVLH